MKSLIDCHLSTYFVMGVQIEAVAQVKEVHEMSGLVDVVIWLQSLKIDIFLRSYSAFFLDD